MDRPGATEIRGLLTSVKGKAGSSGTGQRVSRRGHRETRIRAENECGAGILRPVQLGFT
jgi:hypothetical protein